MRGILDQMNVPKGDPNGHHNAPAAYDYVGADGEIVHVELEPKRNMNVRAAALSESLLGSKIAGAFHPDSWTGRARFAPPIEPTNTATEHPQPPKLAGTGE